MMNGGAHFRVEYQCMPRSACAESGRMGEWYPTASFLRRVLLNQGDVSMPETVVHFQIRMPPVLHEQLASWAKEDKASLNALIVGILEKAIELHEKSGTKE
jgi:hypothetical protein